mmetsp:Transcript_4338/g.10537  ORF Transcript_4338/g.10537 Transcript_4338/m.10537 type:complete len:227 (+) Transcript_4338:1601-2281(+)
MMGRFTHTSPLMVLRCTMEYATSTVMMCVAGSCTASYSWSYVNTGAPKRSWLARRSPKCRSRRSEVQRLPSSRVSDSVGSRTLLSLRASERVPRDARSAVAIWCTARKSRRPLATMMMIFHRKLCCLGASSGCTTSSLSCSTSLCLALMASRSSCVMPSPMDAIAVAVAVAAVGAVWCVACLLVPLLRFGCFLQNTFRAHRFTRNRALPCAFSAIDRAPAAVRGRR